MAKRFSRSTKGSNSQVFVTKPINITDDTTYAAFVANAPVGEVGVFDAALAKHTDAITAAESFFIAQKMTEGVKKTPLYKFKDVVARKRTYLAPVKQVSYIGWKGTGGSLNLAAAPSVGKVYEFAVLETTEKNEPYPTWNYDYVAKTGDVEMDVVQALVASVNNTANLIYKGNTRLVSAKAKADATYGNYAATTGDTFTLVATNGSKELTYTGATPTYDVAVGDFISFDAAAAPTDVVGDIYKVAAVSATGFTLNRPYQGATQTFTEAEAEGTRVKKVTTIVKTGIELTALNVDEHFQVAVRQELENATYERTAFTMGSGTPAQVLEWESEGEEYAGGTTKNTVFDSDFGSQDKFATANGTSETYDYVVIEVRPDAELINTPTSGKMFAQIVVALSKSAGDTDTSIPTYFGV